DVSATGSTHGGVFLNNGQVSYTPDNGYTGAASFSYTVCDNGTTAGSAAALCSTGTVNVTINACTLPTVPTISGATNGTGTQDQACPEQPLTLTATSTGADSYQWFENNDTLNGETGPTLIVTRQANYFVKATNACGTTVNSAAYLVQNPTPHQAFLDAAGPTTFCNGGSVTLRSNSATGIQWYRDNVDIPDGVHQNYVATLAG